MPVMSSDVACHHQERPLPSRAVRRVPGGTQDTMDASHAHRGAPGTLRSGEDADPAPVVGRSALGGPHGGGVTVEAKARSGANLIPLTRAALGLCNGLSDAVGTTQTASPAAGPTDSALRHHYSES